MNDFDILLFASILYLDTLGNDTKASHLDTTLHYETAADSCKH